MAAITLDAVSKIFPGGHAAVRDLTLEIADGELLVVVGPSGSGKSTVLRLIAGLDVPSSGRILIDGRDVTRVAPPERDLAMVFQNYALYPHMTVRDNLGFGLKMRGVSPARIAERVQGAAAALGLETLLERRPAQLSGGQRQRAALGRAMVREPRAFLLDEPLSNLDPLLRAATRAELALLHRRLATTMVYVTHDQEEAMTLGGRIAVMRDGAIEQVASPQDCFDRPANVFVAGFIGSPAINLWPATADADGRLMVSGVNWPIARLAGMAVSDGAAVGIRPHDVAMVGADAAALVGRVAIVEPLGASSIVHVAVDGLEPLIRVVAAGDRQPAVDDRVGLAPRADRLHVFNNRTGRRLAGTCASLSGPAPGQIRGAS